MIKLLNIKGPDGDRPCRQILMKVVRRWFGDDDAPDTLLLSMLYEACRRFSRDLLGLGVLSARWLMAGHRGAFNA